MRQSVVVFIAQNQTDRRIFARFAPMFVGITCVKKHLSNVGVRQFSEFQINNDKAFQTAIEQNQIHAKPFVADAQTLLPADEGETRAELEQKIFQMFDDGFFEFEFRVFVLHIRHYLK